MSLKVKSGKVVREPKWKVVIFHRKEGWYPVNVREDEDLGKHVELNPGTLKIEDIDGNVLWRPQ